MYEEDKTVLSPKEEPEKPEIPDAPVTSEDATVVSDIPMIPEIPETPASEDATMVSDSPTIPEVPVTPEIPVMDDISPIDIDPGEASGGMESPNKDWMAIVSIIAGVFSLCGSVFAPLGCLFSIAAVVLGVLGLKSTKRTLAIIGLVAGGLGILLSLIFGGLLIAELFFFDGGYF